MLVLVETLAIRWESFEAVFPDSKDLQIFLFIAKFVFCIGAVSALLLGFAFEQKT